MITSRDNEKLKLVRKLHERRWREKLGLFVCEGEDLVEAATAEPVELLVAGENVEPRLLAEVSTAAHPPRVIGVYRRDDLPGAEARPVTLALWRVADPGNVGTLIRTADAFGAAVALSEGCADPTGPKALRASAGSIWRVPLLPFESLAGKAGRAVARDGDAARTGRPARRGDVPGRRGARGAAGRARARRRGVDPDRRRGVAERRASQARSRSTSGAVRTAGPLASGLVADRPALERASARSLVGALVDRRSRRRRASVESRRSRRQSSDRCGVDGRIRRGTRRRTWWRRGSGALGLQAQSAGQGPREETAGSLGGAADVDGSASEADGVDGDGWGDGAGVAEVAGDGDGEGRVAGLTFDAVGLRRLARCRLGFLTDWAFDAAACGGEPALETARHRRGRLVGRG